MPTVIYCDRVKHIVSDGWDEIAKAIHYVASEQVDGDLDGHLPAGFIGVTPVGTERHVFLRASSVTSFQPAQQPKFASSDSGRNAEAQQIIRELAAARRAPYLEPLVARAQAVVAGWDS